MSLLAASAATRDASVRMLPILRKKRHHRQSRANTISKTQTNTHLNHSSNITLLYIAASHDVPHAKHVASAKCENHVACRRSSARLTASRSCSAIREVLPGEISKCKGRLYGREARHTKVRGDASEVTTDNKTRVKNRETINV